ncbi:BFD domain protein (2Fe-2S)-binding domain protein [[Leptolyngbya] sp. PCC 7376]|uniref:(2Fe-2S)-binding protein n=1 Tax=[Leptolyngbya] sp. PCC 7376 TaxID=111781 RepID=UPI00029F0A82|nr:(2Fe-2S)-binding protein [[Leptolyngbya] sp. PCC 7376]AFY38755.1 BFD domain protein (2Fe-2S)-binding domain protein [[Leptolyngbya] sp. PCC 7376]
MYVCICRGITEKQIREAVEEETCSMQELSSVMGVGMDCGTCTEYACQLLEKMKQRNGSVKSGRS